MTIVVTGGAGFIGANFILDWLHINDEKVINIDKLTYAGNQENLIEVNTNNNYKFIHADICNYDQIVEIFKKYQPRGIINFAAESHVDRSISSPNCFVETNIIGTFRLLEATLCCWKTLSIQQKENFRLVHISTDEVFGSLDMSDPAFSEQNRYMPNSPYSASKAASDHLVRSYYKTYGLPVLTTNCSNNYGPYQFPEKLIPLIIQNALNNKPIPIYGDGQQIRDWLYVKDHCSAVRDVFDKGKVGEIYNVGGASEKTNLDVAKTICFILDDMIPREDRISYSSLISFVKDRPGHDRRYAINASKIKLEIGWKPSETFDKGIRKTIQWYLDNQSWVNNVTSGKYREWLEYQYSNNL